MVKPGPKPKPNPLTVRVQFRITPETLAVYEGFAQATNTPLNHVLRQVVEGAADDLATLTVAVRQLNGGEDVKGLELFQQMVAATGAQVEVHRSISDHWVNEAKAQQAGTTGEPEGGAAMRSGGAQVPDTGADVSRSDVGGH